MKPQSVRCLVALVIFAGLAFSVFSIAPPTYHPFFKKEADKGLSISAEQDFNYPAGLRSAFEFTGASRSEGTFNTKISTQTVFFVCKIHHSSVVSLLHSTTGANQVHRSAIDLPVLLQKLLI